MHSHEQKPYVVPGYLEERHKALYGMGDMSNYANTIFVIHILPSLICDLLIETANASWRYPIKLNNLPI